MILRRIAFTEFGVFGVLLDGGIPFTLTLERPWLDNKAEVSCIPEGHYTCVRYSSTKYPDTFKVQNVPNRTGILFHTGNAMGHSAGCIILGEKFDPFRDDPGILSSQEGFDEFMDKLANKQTFDLLIQNKGE